MHCFVEHRRLWVSFVALTLTGCGVATSSTAESVGSTRQAGYQRQGYQRQGYQRQGFELGVGAVKGFSLKSLLRAPAALFDSASVVEGTLVVQESPFLGTTASLSACGSFSWGLARSCGWQEVGVGTCKPGDWVSIADRGPDDSMLRACEGATPCEGGTALAANDDFGGARQATVAFQCPPSGAFNLLAGAYVSGGPLTLRPDATGADRFPVLVTRDLKGSTLSAVDFANQTTSVRITGVFPELSEAQLRAYGVTPGNLPVAGVTLRYGVEVFDEKNGQWGPLCGPDLDEQDAASRSLALVTPGWWDAKATRQDDEPDLFTFSCRPGVITKCYRWGYRPWGPAAVDQGSYREAHQTCTRLARADYCGNGDSWTQLDTEVIVYDDDGVQLRGTAADVAQAADAGIVFEAAWVTGGATCLSHTRWANAPKSVNYDTCPTLFDRSNPEPVRRQCDSPEEARQKNTAARMFNDSAEHGWPDGGLPY